MLPSAKTVFIVEDDQSVRDALSLLLGLRGYSVVIFADAESFLDAYRPEWFGCLLIDIRMPGMDGLALQKRLLEQGSRIPIIIITGHGDVNSAREAFRSQAVDFLEKPIDHAKLISSIEEAMAGQIAAQDVAARRSGFRRMLETLTPREAEVMELVVAGRHNREIAGILRISVRTVEVHKAHLMAKLKTDSVADLVRQYLIQRGIEAQ